MTRFRVRRAISSLVELLTMPVGDAWFLFMQWLRRPRWAKRGRMRAVVVTQDGVVVPSVRHVPIRSTKADAKRAALKFARERWKDPTMTWGQARKRIQKLERELREQGVDIGEMAVEE